MAGFADLERRVTTQDRALRTPCGPPSLSPDYGVRWEPHDPSDPRSWPQDTLSVIGGAHRGELVGFVLADHSWRQRPRLALRRGRAYLTQAMPPPDRALSAVGGGAATPAPAPCTGVAGAGSVADDEGRAVAKPVGRVKSVPITTRTAPGRSAALPRVGRPPRALARLAALVSAPAPYSTMEAAMRAGPVLAFPGLNPRVVSARSSWPARPERPEALTASTTT
jgi:hypothetical protein